MKITDLKTLEYYWKNAPLALACLGLGFVAAWKFTYPAAELITYSNLTAKIQELEKNTQKDHGTIKSLQEELNRVFVKVEIIEKDKESLKKSLADRRAEKKMLEIENGNLKNNLAHVNELTSRLQSQIAFLKALQQPESPPLNYKAASPAPSPPKKDPQLKYQKELPQLKKQLDQPAPKQQPTSPQLKQQDKLGTTTNPGKVDSALRP